MPKSQNPAAPAAGLRRTAGISSHAVSTAIRLTPRSPRARPVRECPPLLRAPSRHLRASPVRAPAVPGPERASQSQCEEQTKRARL